MDLFERIKKIPEGGFFKQSTEAVFLNFACRLKDKGFEDEEIVENLTDLYNAVSNEYGN